MKQSSYAAVAGAGALVLSLLAWGCGGPLAGSGNLTITVAASQTTLQAGETADVQATVMDSGGNPDVTWSLSGAGCPNSCGNLSSTTANPATYTAPQFLGATSTVTVTATAVADPSRSASVDLTLQRSLSVDCPSGSEAVLNGSYAFLLRGGGSSGSVIIAGNFYADGLGNIVAGFEDVNSESLGPRTGLTIPGGGSLYSVGSDHRGCLGLVNSQGQTLLIRFALSALSSGVATRGRIIEFDDANGGGTRAEGFLAKQDPSSFATDQVSGAYAFGQAGTDASGGRFVSAGVFAAATGALSSGNFDSDDAGTIASNVSGVTGTYSVAPTGRGTLLVNVGAGENFVLYMISSARFLAMSTDVLDASHPLRGGEFLRQTLATFDDASLNASAVVSTTGFDTGLAAPVATVGLLTPDGTGSAQVVLDINDGGFFLPLQTASAAYSVGANGRTTTAGIGPPPPVLYLIGANDGFWVGTDPAASFGRIEPQTGGPFSNASLTGTFGYGTEGAGVGQRLTAVGADVFDGFENNQSTEDESTPAGLFPNLPLPNQTYSFSPGSVPSGRGFLDVLGHTLAYIVSPTRLVCIDTPATKPRIVVFEK